jgi:hypothetical protein
MIPSAQSRAHTNAPGGTHIRESGPRGGLRRDCSDAQNLNINSRLIFFKGLCLGYLEVSARFLSGNAASCKFPLRTSPALLIGL